MKTSAFKEMVGKAIKATIKQGEKSVGSDGHCRYRGELGFKCVIGHMIPDEKYKDAIEGFDPNDVLNGIGMKITIKQSITILDLQLCHDDALGDFVEGFIAKLNNKIPSSLIPKDIGELTQ